MELLINYINNLGFSGKLESTDFGELFLYKIKLSNQIPSKIILIPFIFYKDKNSLFKYHLIEWNKNELDYFIAVGDDTSYIIKTKEKPERGNPLKKEILVDGKCFDYGINTAGYEDVVPSEIPFTKEKIDNSFFFDFVLKKQKEIKNEVDTHLLNNLIALKNKLSEFDSNNENINGLILKCLFVKYLEDRNILSNTSLVDTLKSRNPEELQKTFEDISIINGDILKKDLQIIPEHINELEIFFTHDYKAYKESQPSLFYPYRFDKIPIQLISNVYEEFLGKTNKEEKKTKGIFYTRTFVVDFMLSYTIYPKLERDPYATVLDPACGSGAFLVQAFKHILNNQKNGNLSIDEKAKLLKKQIFGIDIDKRALQITAFSLYLILLEGISKEEIKEQIKRRNPILPLLIGSNLQNKNTITDEIQFNIEIEENNKKENYTFTKFDCIVANPPWAIIKDNTVGSKEIRKQHKEKKLYSSIHSRYLQLSQFFILKIYKLSHENTQLSIIVNSSNFYSSFSNNFRKDFLKKYRLQYYFELSNIKKILFKGHSKSKGVNEPASVLILDLKNNTEEEVKYIVPKLTKFNEKLRTITYSSTDIKIVKQSDLLNEDILWRIFVSGNWKDYQLIKKRIINKEESIVINCAQGIQAQILPSFIVTHQAISELIKIQFTDELIEKFNNLIGKIYHTHKDLKNAFDSIAEKNNIKIDRKTYSKIKASCKKKKVEYEPRNEKLYFDKDDFKRYSFGLEKQFLNTILKRINWNNNIKRKRNEELYIGNRFLILRQPNNEEDGFRLKILYTNQHFVFADKIIGLKIIPISDYYIYFAILNSMFAGYFLINTSSQWNKGRRNTLLNDDLKNFPFPKIKKPNSIAHEIHTKVEQLKKLREQNRNTETIEKQLDELVFDLYGMLEFEKEIIREFYQINVERKNDTVKLSDIQVYVEKFREIYQLVMKNELLLNASLVKSINIGTIVRFDVVYEKDFIREVKHGDFEQRKVLQLVKDREIQHEMLNGFINEEKVKIYDDKKFYIIKSNQFKDWTKRQAINDANEEMHELLKKL